MEPFVRHPDYYYPKADLTFAVSGKTDGQHAQEIILSQADHTLYRVHSDFLKSVSPLISTLSTLPPPPDNIEGSTDYKPIIIPGIRDVEMSTLMRAVYKRSVRNSLP